MSIQVKADADGERFHVTVDGQTRHIVTVDPAYAEKLTAGRFSTLELVKRSFEFLLEREPNTSILRRFDLPVIGQYFREYESTIGK